MNRISAYLFARTAELRARSDEGVSAVEYGFLVGGIVVVMAGSVVLFGAEVKTMFDNLVTELTAINTP